MSITISPEQRVILEETRRADNPAEFQALLKDASSEMARIVREDTEPNRPIQVVLTELRDLYLAISQHSSALAKHAYGAKRRSLFVNAIRLLDTAQTWFGENSRTGAYRPRSVAEVVQSSRPWRARLRAFGGHAFVFEPAVAERFADVNSTGTLDEEIQDLESLNALVSEHKNALESVGMTDAFALEGQSILEEAKGRDLAGVLGLRSRADAFALRNRILTYAIGLGREARAAGINACFNNEEARRRFEATSFRHAIRHLRSRRKVKASESVPEVEAAPTEAVN